MTTAQPFPLRVPLTPSACLDRDQALAQASSLLHCAAAVAYENADAQRGEARHLALSVVHLLGMAHVLVIHGLEGDPTPKNAEHAEAGD